jgi:putative transposase
LFSSLSAAKTEKLSLPQAMSLASSSTLGAQQNRGWSARYVIMPDHIHLFCAPGVNPTERLDQWVRYWKNVASKNWPRLNEHPIWQRDFWDTQLRRHENYDEKWDYILENPVRAGLVTESEDSPFHGELNVLEW